MSEHSYSIIVKSIPVTNIEDREKDIFIKGLYAKLKYGSMANRSFRIDDEMLSNILDSGNASIKVFRYIKSHINSQTNKVTIKASDVIEYLKCYNIKADAPIISKGIKKLIEIGFIIKCNKLKIYKHEPSNVFLVNPNYCVISSPDVIFRRIQSEEHELHDYETIKALDKQRIERELSSKKLRLNNRKTKNNENEINDKHDKVEII